MLYSIVFIIIAVALALVLYRMCSDADQKRLENLPGVYFCYEDGSPCLHFYFHEEDGKVWYYDFGRKFAQPAPYDSMEQLKSTLKPHKGGWKYKIIFILFLVFWFGVFSCGVSYAAAPMNAERYQQLAEEYAPVLEKADAALELDRAYDARVNEHLLKSNNPFIRMIFMWELVNFVRYTTYMEITGQAPWLRRR